MGFAAPRTGHRRCPHGRRGVDEVALTSRLGVSGESGCQRASSCLWSHQTEPPLPCSKPLTVATSPCREHAAGGAIAGCDPLEDSLRTAYGRPWMRRVRHVRCDVDQHLRAYRPSYCELPCTRRHSDLASLPWRRIARGRIAGNEPNSVVAGLGVSKGDPRRGGDRLPGCGTLYEWRSLDG